MNMTFTNVREFIIDYVGGCAAGDHGRDVSLLQSGYLDSFSFMELLNALERNFSIRVDLGGQDPELLTSLNGLSRIVCQARGGDEISVGDSGSFSSVLRMSSEHPEWNTLALLFEAMHSEFVKSGLKIPLVINGGSSWLNGLGSASGGNVKIHGAIMNGQLVGFVQTAMKLLPPYLGAKPVGEIVFLYVIPEHRRVGLGRELLEEAMRELYESGASSVELKVLVGNLHGQAFWRSMGFESELLQMRTNKVNGQQTVDSI